METRVGGLAAAYTAEPSRAMPVRNHALWFVVVLWVGCRLGPEGHEPDRHAQLFESVVLDSLLASAPHTVMDLDGPSVDVWTPDLELGRPRDSLVLAGNFSFVIAQDSIYFGNYDHAIYAADLSGALHRQIGHRGKGPGEFDRFWTFGFSGHYFFIGESSRIQVLDRRFGYVAALPPLKDWIRPGDGLAVSSEFIYTGCGRGAPFRICPRDARPSFEESVPFLPSLDIDTTIPINSIVFGATPSGSHVAVAFMGFPYLLIFNEHHEHTHTIRLVGNAVREHAGNYTITRPGVPGIGLRMLISRVHVLSNEYLAVPMKDVWHFIRMVDDGTFTHTGAVRLMRADAPEAKPVNTSSQGLLHGEHLYVYANDSPHLLRYAFQF